MFKRVMVAGGTELPTPSRPGSGFLGNIIPTLVSTDAGLTLTVSQIATGLVTFTGFTVGRAVTTPTAALILAANPGMDVGDSFSFLASVTTAFAGTWTAGTGVTLAGRATLPASSTLQLITVTKLSATTVSWTAS